MISVISKRKMALVGRFLLKSRHFVCVRSWPFMYTSTGRKESTELVLDDRSPLLLLGLRYRLLQKKIKGLLHQIRTPDDVNNHTTSSNRGSVFKGPLASISSKGLKSYSHHQRSLSSGTIIKPLKDRGLANKEVIQRKQSIHQHYH